jgi:hypothetical protein
VENNAGTAPQKEVGGKTKKTLAKAKNMEEKGFLAGAFVVAFVFFLPWPQAGAWVAVRSDHPTGAAALGPHLA